MKSSDYARWAQQFAKKGTRAAVTDDDEDDEPAPPRRPGPAQPSYQEPWGAPGARTGQVWGPPPETDMLVRPAPSAYAGILSRVPDLAPHVDSDDQGAAQALHDAALPVPERVRQGDPKDQEPRGFAGPVGHAAIVPLASLGGNKPN